MTTDTIVMRETRLVDWVYSKSEPLRGGLEDSEWTSEGIFFVFSEVERLFPEVGSVRNKLQCLTVQQNPRLSLWMLD